MIKKNIILLLVFIVATLLSEIVSANKTIDESSWHKYVVSRVIDNFIKINSKDLNLQSQKTDAHITFTVLKDGNIHSNILLNCTGTVYFCKGISEALIQSIPFKKPPKNTSEKNRLFTVDFKIQNPKQI